MTVRVETKEAAPVSGKPWTRHYDPDVPASLVYPRVPLQAILDGFGRIALSPRARQTISSRELLNAFKQPSRTGRNRCAKHDRLQGCRLLETCESRDGVKFWIVIEADRSRSTVMMPGESLNCAIVESE